MNAAAEAFSIRHVCGFGAICRKAWHRSTTPSCVNPPTTRAVIQDGRKAALISFDVTAGRLPAGAAHPSQPDCRRPCDVARKRRAAGRNASCRPSRRSSFAGLASSLVVWLLSGGTLVLHHPFDEEVLEQQINEHGLRNADRAGATGAAAGRNRPRGADAEPAQCHRPLAHARTGRLQRALDRATGDADGRLPVRRSRIVRRPPDRRGRLAGPDQARTAWRAARIAGLVDRGRDPADAARHAGIARTDGAGRCLCATSAAAATR